MQVQALLIFELNAEHGDKKPDKEAVAVTRLVVYVAQIAEAAAAFREELANNYFQSYEEIQYSLNYIFDV